MRICHLVFKVALLRLNPSIDVLRVGDPEAPPLGTPDPEVLNYPALAQRAIGNRQPQGYARTSRNTLGCGWTYLGITLSASQNTNRSIGPGIISGLGSDGF
jgi:hypothetical protein